MLKLSRLLALLVLLLPVAAQAQQSQTRSQNQTQINSCVVPNTQGLITEACVAQMLLNMNASTGTLLDNNLYSGYLAISGTSLQNQAAGVLGVAGLQSSTPVVSASGEGNLYLTTAGGLNMDGEGSAYDMSILNKNGATVAVVPTGQTWLSISGGVILSGAAPTTPNGKVSFGGTASGSASCGSLAGANACLVINVSGTAHFIPYY